MADQTAKLRKMTEGSIVADLLAIDETTEIDSAIRLLNGHVDLCKEKLQSGDDPDMEDTYREELKDAKSLLRKLSKLKSPQFERFRAASPSRLRTGFSGRSFGKKGSRNMARRRSFKAFGISVPAVGNPMKILKYNVQAQDVVIGALAGLVGSSVAKKAVGFVLDKLPFQLPATVVALTPALSTSLVGAALYYGQKGSARAKGHLVGAITAGAALTAWDLLKAHYPQYFNEVVELRLNGYYVADPRRLNGVVVNDPAYNGVVVNDPQRALSDANLAELAAASMVDSGEDYSDVDQLMA